MAKILGIDLGTTNSVMAIIEGGQPRILENQEGSRLTPSVVAISKSGERLVGVTAKRQAVVNPSNTIFSVKRLIGRRFSDNVVQYDKKLLPYEIVQSQSGGVEVAMNGKKYRPEEVSAYVLMKMKQDAESKLGEEIEQAVITCPAYFDDSQRAATKAAGEIAGFKVRRVLPEPTAAALAYGFNKHKEERVLVYDFGGGTFDISVLEIGGDTIEVKGIGGDTHLGGDDFDRRIIDHLIIEYKKQEGIDLSKDNLALQRLKEGAERAKHELSTMTETEINLPFITSDASGPKHFLMKLTRAKLEDLVRDYIDKSIELVQQTLRESKLTKSDINELILVGGQTRMPAIQEAVKKYFGKDPHKDINPDEVVAVGAAVQAGILQGEVRDVLLLDATPLSLGIETLGNVMTTMVAKNTTVPTARTETYSTASDNQTSVEIHVLQGERPMAQDNKSLGRFILDGIPPAPRGVPQIEVTFDIDANGILSVTAMDKATKKKQSIRIEGSTGLSKEEIERMKHEAEAHAAEDAKKKELIDTRNSADALMYQAEKSMKDLGDKVPADVKEKITAKMNDLKAVRDRDDVEAIKRSIQELSDVVQQIGSQMYGKQDNENQPKDENQPKSDTPPENQNS
ncbi:MAG: molecular chaperone DnaK [Candidatus Brennerbacteria bacterium CG11_big_fil_rev_8_21_14_0_20_43_10]|uniref:Chaperone protein DnaK n=3 Tax=Candidatus Brenneribacteriota TaxID=1817902 RepID=A0A2M8C3B4_9BACT|nr:MAG: molecular chaperone DnaK [Parcubacteria group bacterium CG1_02_44_31]PIP50423.1 MAG: molecular chaperone DnaK [Candidatus Brennerbacteria bacterium CG23_combo_of_CG06-09_8_20_14_all_44_41]PIR26788.1 MAG: molecular chaperone DnaK [Candidatus Brennerbacteria bacterium CG11_big_fil_rev_8_21_14_0_20_43_10]PIX28994.1 MAG: molecular chaperone DnaK [Candidatus Brennerbacteria bacterium CG_4_8_14_3_um_filter_43_14]PJA18936.1 MAG: molecular chaperone DnaK [Candidatus Brennerbacteria bacterium CG